MNYTFSDRIGSLQPSAIREILKYSSIKEFISLSAGNPAPEAFPTEAIAEISADIFKNHPIDALQYSVTEGYTPLRDHLKEYMRKKNSVGTDDDELIITSGAQQVMELSAKALCNEGDTVICEDPSFIGSLNAFRSYGLRLCGVAMEENGISVEKLEQALKTEKNVRFIYTIPNFQNPTGATMSLEKRREVYRLAKQYGVMIVEDNPYGDIRFAGEDLPSIKSFDTDGIVIYAGSFSKVLSPGMRVGFTVAPKPVVSKLVVCKQVSDVHTNIWSQIVAHEFMTKYDYEAHLENNRRIYKHKAELMMQLIDSELSDFVTYTPVEGGLFIWCRIKNDADMNEFCADAARNSVGIVPGNAFAADESQKSCSFRLNYSTPTDDDMTAGIKILHDISRKYL